MRTNQHDPFEYVEEKKIFKNKDILEVSYIPDQLPEREKEIFDIKWYLRDALRGYRPKNVFIYGHPGVGKTACCKKVLRDLHEKITERKISNLKIMYINCAGAHSECQLIADIANFFTKKQRAPEKGWSSGKYYRTFGKILDELGGIFIIVLDEVNKLLPENENLLYNLTRASEHILTNAKITIVGISNNLTFYEALDSGIKSSMCQREIIIHPYTAPQLQKILTQRAKEAFTKDALGEGVIPLCAAFAAQEHGDARKALDLLALAGELAEAEDEEHIREKHVQRAKEEWKRSRVKESIKNLPTQKKIALLAIAQLVGRKGSTTTGEAYKHYNILTQKNGLSSLTSRRFSNILSDLNAMGICNTNLLSKGYYGRTTKIKLAIPLNDVKSAISKDEMLAPIV